MEKSTFKPSPYQLAIYDFIEKSKGNAVISAVAGSGKTTTIVNALKLISPSESVIFIAFNKSIVEELKEKVPSFVDVSTIHSVGWQAIRKKYKNPKIDDKKVYYFLKEVSMMWEEIQNMDNPDDISDYIGRVRKLIDLARLNLINDAQVLEDIADKHGIEIINGECVKALECVRALSMKTDVFDFTDMLYIPAIKKLQMPKQYNFVFVDEAQDLNVAQQEILKSLLAPNARFIAVGDACQPKGTKVRVVMDKANRWNDAIIVNKNIEDLKVGDVVVSADMRSCTFTYNKKIIGISKRQYNDELISVQTSSNKISNYTVNHHCIANFKTLINKYCVYIMRKGDLFRIGVCKMDYGRIGSGFIKRCISEKSDSGWILDVYNTSEEAQVMESYLSAKYGIPELTFIPAWNSTGNLIKNVWKKLSHVNLKERVINCLNEFGRRIEYPLYNRPKSKEKSYQTMKRPIVVHACNLIDGCLMLPFTRLQGNDNCHFNTYDWEEIKTSRITYKGLVYSLTVEDYHLYVADDILTHNCQAIYGFAGSDVEAFDKLKNMPNTIELPLSVSYRCGKKIIEKAQTIVPHISYPDTAADGEVRDNGLIKDIQEGDMVLCRNTAPLVMLCLQLLAKGKKAMILGGDIGKSLISMVKKTKKRNTDEMLDALRKEREKLIKALCKKKRIEPKEAEEDKQIIMFDEKVRVFDIIVSENKIKTTETLIKRLEELFRDDKQGVVFATIHKSKGLESNNVHIICPELMPSKYAKKDWEKVQEQNLMYVAYTRAKKALIFNTEFEYEYN